MRQLIIARKNLNMSPGKLAAQVSHASVAFLSHIIRKGRLQKRVSLDTVEMERYEIMITMFRRILFRFCFTEGHSCWM